MEVKQFKNINIGEYLKYKDCCCNDDFCGAAMNIRTVKKLRSLNKWKTGNIGTINNYDEYWDRYEPLKVKSHLMNEYINEYINK